MALGKTALARAIYVAFAATVDSAFFGAASLWLGQEIPGRLADEAFDVILVSLVAPD